MSLNEIKKAFHLDEADKEGFNREITKYNRYVLYVMSMLTFVIECVTISRIFIVSESKLGSLNRVYFAFYLASMVVSILMFVSQFVNSKKLIKIIVSR